MHRPHRITIVYIVLLLFIRITKLVLLNFIVFRIIHILILLFGALGLVLYGFFHYILRVFDLDLLLYCSFNLKSIQILLPKYSDDRNNIGGKQNLAQPVNLGIQWFVLMVVPKQYLNERSNMHSKAAPEKVEHWKRVMRLDAVLAHVLLFCSSLPIFTVSHNQN